MTPTLPRAARPPRQRGVSLIEFTIVFPVAVLFVLALIQTGFVFMAKSTLSHATFMAARAGAINNARDSVIKEAMIRGLSPFYQNATHTDDSTRLALAYAEAKLDAVLFLKIQKLSPSAAAFKDFGVKDPATKVVAIPNDNLEWRSNVLGSTSKVNIRDANLLRIRTVYAYELKVPLMAWVVSRVMCGGSAGVEAWGNVSLLDSVYGLKKPVDCALYYQQGRMPIESVATIEMQSAAIQN